MTGSFTWTLDFDLSSNIYNFSAVGSKDIFISNHDPNGSLIWAKDIGGTSKGYPHSMEVDDDGSIYLTGKFFDSTDFDPSVDSFELISHGAYDIFLARYSSSGELDWAKNIGGNGYDWGSSIHLGKFGKLYVTGNFQDTVDFDPGISTSILIAPFHLPIY